MLNNYPAYNYSEQDALNGLARFVKLDNPESYPFDEFHSHKYNEIMVFITGGGIHSIDFNDHAIADYSIHLLASGNLHWLERSIASQGFAIVYKEQFLYKLEFVNPDINYRQVFDHSAIINLDEKGRENFQYIFSELLNTNSNDVYMLNLIGTFLTKIAAAYSDMPVKPKKHDPLISVMIDLINKNFKKHLTLQEYAAMVNLSPITLQKRVKNYSGKSVHTLQQERLLKEAKRLSCMPDTTVNEISFELGFKEQAHFSNWFKSLTGISPSEYKI